MVLTPVIRNAPKGLKYVMIRIHDGGSSPKYKSTGYKISEKHWNKNGNYHRKNWVRTTENRHREINQRVDDMLRQISEEMEGKTPKNILSDITKNSGGKKKFLSYAKTYLKFVRNQATKVSCEQGVKKLEQYLEEKDQLYLTFNDIDRPLTKLYYNWLLEQGYANSTCNQFFGVFRTIYNDAITDEQMGIEGTANLFKKFNYAKSKSTNNPLTKDEFENMKFYPLTKRNHILTRNMWLFQYSNAFRINEVICMKWKNLKWINHEFVLDIHTSKTTMRVYRQLQVDVVELLTPAIERYYPEIKEKHQKIFKRKEWLHETYEEMLKHKPNPMKAEDILLKINSGQSPEEVSKEYEEVKDYEKFLEDWEKDMNNHETEKRHLYRVYLEKLRTGHPDDFVWDKPQAESFNNERMNKEDFKAYKRCLASNHGYLERIQKIMGIKTKLSSHVARYTASQFMFDSGMDFNKISQFLTHSNHDTTEKYIQRLGVDSGQLSKFLAQKLNVR